MPEDQKSVDAILNEIIARDNAKEAEAAQIAAQTRDDNGKFAKVDFTGMSQNDFARHLSETYGVR